jgi:hypothetical protein
MTGEKRRAKTLQERFGFIDSDLTTPKHDEIVMWLDSNMQQVANSICSGWRKSDVQAATELGIIDLPQFPGVSVDSKIWEAPVLDRTFTIGFVDMLCNFVVPELVRGCQEWGMRLSHGLCDQCVLETLRYRISVAFEVKTEIPSIGETVRQIRLYQTYMRDSQFFVVTPDLRWQDLLRGQGIGVVAYPC